MSMEGEKIAARTVESLPNGSGGSGGGGGNGSGGASGSGGAEGQDMQDDHQAYYR